MDHGYSLKYGLIIMNHRKIFGLITNHGLNFEAIMDHDSRVLNPIMDHNKTIYHPVKNIISN